MSGGGTGDGRVAGPDAAGKKSSNGESGSDAARAKAEAAAQARAKREAEEAAKPPWERDPKAPETVDAANDPLVVALRRTHDEDVVTATRTAGDLVLEVEGARIAEIGASLKRDHHYDLLVDICGVDYPERAEHRFEIVYHLLERERNQRVRLRVRAAEDQEVPSVCGIWRGANWCEREIFDMFGVRFSGHPDMTRILLWEGFSGYPLRKDFPVEGIETGAAIYPEFYETDAGPIDGTGTGWKAPPSEEGERADDEEPSST